jgi:hypothetical protein
MTRRTPAQAEAHALLDRAQAGADIPSWRITEALRVTGDADDDQTCVVWLPSGAWKPRPAGLAPATWCDGRSQ